MSPIGQTCLLHHFPSTEVPGFYFHSVPMDRSEPIAIATKRARPGEVSSLLFIFPSLVRLYITTSLSPADRRRLLLFAELAGKMVSLGEKGIADR
jgi:hypothetical protein